MKKINIVLLTYLFSTLCFASGFTTVHDDTVSPTKKNFVVIYLKAKNNSSVVTEYFQKYEVPFWKSLASGTLKDSKITMLAQANKEARMSAFFANLFRSWPFINLPLALHDQALVLSPFYHNVFKPVLDIVITIELPSETISESQVMVFKEIRNRYQQHFDLSISNTIKYVAMSKGNEKDSDYRIAFLVPWKTDMNHQASQTMWLGHHRKLALSLLPDQLKNYVIIQTQETVNSDAFDNYYQGICFESIESSEDIKSLAKEKGAWKASLALAADEENFIGHPSFLVLKTILSL